jgi:LysM repeat protein
MAGMPWTYGAVLAALAGVGAIIAREQGWPGSLALLNRSSAARNAQATSERDDNIRGSFDHDMFDDIPLMLAQSEPEKLLPSDLHDEDTAPAGRVVPASQNPPETLITLSLDDGADEPAEEAPPKIAKVGFEEETPPSKSGPQADPANGRNSSGANKPAVAARPTDSTKAIGSSRNGAATLTRGAPLMDRDRIEKLIEEGEYVEAQKELSRWYWQNPDEEENLLPQLNKMAQALYFSPQPMYYEPYVVKPGDQLRVVGQRYKISWEYIARLNRVDARKIRMGQKLKVVPGPFAATIFLDRYELVVHQNGSFVKSYPVGVGKDGTTPVGTFTVKNKMVDPTYYGPEGVIAHDDPVNPLGERWIDIGDSYGIHGTIDPESIGKNESRGCIRMLNSDVEEVYDVLVIGSEVKIQK